MSLERILKKAEIIGKFAEMLGDMPIEIKQAIIMMEFYPHLMTLNLEDIDNFILN